MFSLQRTKISSCWALFLIIIFTIIRGNSTAVAWNPPAASSSQHIWISGYGGPQLRRFDLEGAFESPQLLPTSWVYSVGVNSSQAAWIADTALLQICKIGKGELNPSTCIPVAGIPYDLSVDPWDHIWVVTSGNINKEAILFDEQGQTLARIPLDTWRRQFPLETSIASDSSGDAWVTDPEYEKVSKVTARGGGQMLFSFTWSNHTPIALAVDRAGNAWIGWRPSKGPGTPADRYSITIYDRFGTLRKTIELPLSPYYTTSFPPPGIAVDGLQQVWISNPYHNREVSVFNQRGDHIRTINVPYSPGAISADGRGAVWIVTGSPYYGELGSIVKKRASDGASLGSISVKGMYQSARGDISGFTLANIVQPGGDVDGDGYLNYEEIDLQTDPFDQKDAPQAWLKGNVNTGSTGATPAPVLFVNDDPGSNRHFVRLVSWEPYTVFMDVPPQATGPARYVLYAYPISSNLSDEEVFALLETLKRDQPRGLGVMGFPTPLNVGDQPPVVIANNIGRRVQFGVPLLESSPAPSFVFRFPRGLGRQSRVILQGIIEDPNSCSTTGHSITNAVIVDVR